MPILEIEIVSTPGERASDGLAQRLADAAGEVFGTPPGRTWVRLRELAPTHHAENGAPDPPRPVFVEVLHYEPPAGEGLRKEAAALAARLAAACDRPPENVHVLYQPPARGRIAFGGELRD